MDIHKNYLIITSIFFLVIALLFGWFYFSEKGVEKQISSEQTFQEGYEDLQELHHGDFSEEAVALAEVLISDAPNKRSEAHIKLLQAASYLSNDYRKGFDLFKEIAADESYSVFQRGLAVQYLADGYMLGSRPFTVADSVFLGEPYASFMRESSSVLEAVRKLYGYTLEFSSVPVFPINQYRVAELYATQLLNDPSAYNNLESNRIRAKVREHFDLGEGSMENFLSTVPEEGQVVYMQWLRANVLGYLASFEDDPKLLNKAEEAFDHVGILNVDTHIDNHTERQILWASLYHALFLNNTYGSNRDAKIDTLLVYIVKNSPGTAFSRFIKRIPSLGDEYKNMKSDILSLSTRNSEFAGMLKGLGWEL